LHTVAFDFVGLKNQKVQKQENGHRKNDDLNGIKNKTAYFFEKSMHLSNISQSLLLAEAQNKPTSEVG